MKQELKADNIAVLVLRAMGYKPEAAANLLDRIVAMHPHKLRLVLPEEFLDHRCPTARKSANLIYKKDPAGIYKNYRYFTEKEFNAIKEIVKQLQQRSGY